MREPLSLYLSIYQSISLSIVSSFSSSWSSLFYSFVLSPHPLISLSKHIRIAFPHILTVFVLGLINSRIARQLTLAVGDINI